MFILILGMVCVSLFVILLVFAMSPLIKEERPTLNLQDITTESMIKPRQAKRKKDFLDLLGTVAVVLKPVVGTDLRKRIARDLSLAQSPMTPELFMFFKIMGIVALLVLLPGMFPSDMMLFSILLSCVVGYMLPEIILKGKIRKIKDEIIRDLPDTVDLLGLCVNAGLDFMMALKWVVDKSSRSVIIIEMDNILQEISVGKPRREALRDLARKYEIPDLSSFSRTLIQADKMGTSVSEALNILSEDMRLARYRRGEAVALKAPLKMLLPLLFCIFPVVFILVGAPIFLDFVMNNPLKDMGN